jgi:hypothetical protein
MDCSETARSRSAPSRGDSGVIGAATENSDTRWLRILLRSSPLTRSQVHQARVRLVRCPTRHLEVRPRAAARRRCRSLGRAERATFGRSPRPDAAGRPEPSPAVAPRRGALRKDLLVRASRLLEITLDEEVIGGERARSSTPVRQRPALSKASIQGVAAIGNDAGERVDRCPPTDRDGPNSGCPVPGTPGRIRGLASTSILASTQEPPASIASFSSTGESCLHGPHQFGPKIDHDRRGQ